MSTPTVKNLSTVLSSAPKSALISASSSIPPPSSSSSTTTAATVASRRVPLDKRKRTETSCDKCKSRKQKCRKEPGQDACRYCILHNIECLTTQPRKKRLYGSVEGLSNRLALLESLVKGLLPEADVSNLEEMRQLGLSLGISLPDPANGAPNDSDPENSTGTASAIQPGTDTAGPERDEPLSFKLLPDQQGQVQYIGPSSSFSFHLKLRSLCGQGTRREFVLFGRNPAEANVTPGDDDNDPNAFSSPRSAAVTTTNNSPCQTGSGAATETEAPAFDSLITAYFAHINPDFPVLHEVSFRVAYGEWLEDNSSADPAWLCSFLCMLLLARRVARVPIPEEEEKRWWRRIQTLLPVVIFTSSVVAVQALLLAAIHLHNTNHRDACWNLTGTAVRIAFAIGLHQDNVNGAQKPLARELRKCLWWTLYAFEQMQVSSYDRPSAVDQFGFKVSCPNAQILDSTQLYPPEYCKWFNRMVVHLSSTCRAPKNTKSSATEELYAGPLSPAFGVKRDLERWQVSLPQHLRMEALESSRPTFQRPILLLHALYHYTVIVLCRAALLERTTLLAREGADSPNTALIELADFCAESGKALARILLRLQGRGKLDVIVWWDGFYALSSASVLLLDIVCTHCLGTLSGGVNSNVHNEVPESRILLSQLTDLAQQHNRNEHIPGTIEKFISIIPELHAMADSAINKMLIAAATTVATSSDSIASPTTISATTMLEPLLQDHPPSQPRPHLPSQPQQQQPQEALPMPHPMAHQNPHNHHQPPPLSISPFMFSQSTTNNGALVFADTSASSPHHPHHHHPYNIPVSAGPTQRFFPTDFQQQQQQQQQQNPHPHPHSHNLPHTHAVNRPANPLPHQHQHQHPHQYPHAQHPPPQQQQPQNPNHIPSSSSPRFDRNLQMSFMDFTVNQIQEWNWADLGSLLGGNGNGNNPGTTNNGGAGTVNNGTLTGDIQGVDGSAGLGGSRGGPGGGGGVDRGR
ncbi:unnamed protein product [Periconia digitata]|uniref:Zn(2)-C6 fungal-type domain-containing protein n=1 Tax=Periconia digitata TaxID=1303443 RepID=A0A9W4UVM0_9PLEO|nr:unnamed protein product [Periconia digitata]